METEPRTQWYSPEPKGDTTGTRPSDLLATLRVVLADDHPLVREGIRHALSYYEDLQVVAEADDGFAALRALETHATDVLLLDLRMPHLDGFGCLQEVRERWPDVRVLILSVDEDPELAVEALRRGASGFITKSVRPADLAAAIRQTVGGAVTLGGPHLTMAVSTPPPTEHGLTEREQQVLRLVAEGRTNAQIAKALFVSVKTVKYHLTSIFAKLGVANRTQAALSPTGRRPEPPW